MLQPCCNRSRTHPNGAGKRWCKKRQKSRVYAVFSDRAEPSREVLPGPLYTNGTPTRLVGKRILFGVSASCMARAVWSPRPGT